MKNTITTLFVILGITFGFAQENDSPEFTGENFSLEGALAMFKKAKNIEEFENLINQENNNVNNLDLNNDGETDYINVDDIQENDNHVIVLSTYLSDTDVQDIATIAIEKTGSESAILQIDGDNSLYAENTIVEPLDTTDVPNNNGYGPATPQITTNTIIVNVWLWPSVRYIYGPRYVLWKSPYRWRMHPKWWKPWRPFSYVIFYKKNIPHRAYFHKTPTRRVVVARKVYTPKRHTSTLVVHKNRGTTTIVHKNNRGKVKIAKTKKSPAKGRRH